MKYTLLICYLLVSCNSNKKIKEGDEVWVNYIAINSTDDRIDKSNWNPERDMPLRIIAGDNKAPYKIADYALNMKIGEKKEYHITSKEIYDKGLFYKFDTDTFHLINRDDTLYITLEILNHRVIRK